MYNNHFAVHLKLTQHCISTILQLKKKKVWAKKKKLLFSLHIIYLFLRLIMPHNWYLSIYTCSHKKKNKVVLSVLIVTEYNMLS